MLSSMEDGRSLIPVCQTNNHAATSTYSLPPLSSAASRIVITLGDVLHEEGALVGDTVVLTVRIEALTPPDAVEAQRFPWEPRAGD